MEIRKLEGHIGRVSSVAVTPDNKRVVSGGGDGAVKVWDLTGLTDIISVFYADANVACCATNGQQIVAGDSLGNVHRLVLGEHKAGI
jgi:WD40 repeat protein